MLVLRLTIASPAVPMLSGRDNRKTAMQNITLNDGETARQAEWSRKRCEISPGNKGEPAWLFHRVEESLEFEGRQGEYMEGSGDALPVQSRSRCNRF